MQTPSVPLCPRTSKSKSTFVRSPRRVPHHPPPLSSIVGFFGGYHGGHGEGRAVGIEHEEGRSSKVDAVHIASPLQAKGGKASALYARADVQNGAGHGIVSGDFLMRVPVHRWSPIMPPKSLDENTTAALRPPGSLDTRWGTSPDVGLSPQPQVSLYSTYIAAPAITLSAPPPLVGPSAALPSSGAIRLFLGQGTMLSSPGSDIISQCRCDGIPRPLGDISSSWAQTITLDTVSIVSL